jgi:transketolase
MAVSVPETDWIETARRVARGVRRRVLEHTLAANGGYLSQACSSAELLATLYTRIMHLGASTAPPVPRPFPGTPRQDNPGYFTGASYNGPHLPHLDRFYLSPAHYALVLYATLIEVGRMDPAGLRQFNQDGSTVEMIGAEHSPGMEVTTGSLAQGLSQAIGVALARRLKGETGRTVVFLSDGEFQEGETWEAFEVMHHHRLGRIGIFVDVNRQQCDGRMSDVLGMGDLKAKVEAFGADVREVDGHDVAAIAEAGAVFPEERPLVVLAYTDPCRGLDILREREPKFHYVRFRSPEERQLYEELLHRLEEEA